MSDCAIKNQVIDSLIEWARNTTYVNPCSSYAVVNNIKTESAELINYPGLSSPIELRIEGSFPFDCDIVATEICASIELRPYRAHDFLSVFQPIVLTFSSTADWDTFKEDSRTLKSLKSPLLIISDVEKSVLATNEMKRYAAYLEKSRKATIAKALSTQK